MISFKEVKEKSRRKNHNENVWVHPFSARISVYFSWLFINLGMSANQVTVIFFLCGIASGFVLLTDEIAYAIVGYVLFRLHILFDVCDGEVARFRNQISRYGIYWDQLIHFFTYSFILFCIGYSRLSDNAPDIFFFFIGIAVIGKVLDLAAKNIYFRVLFSSQEEQDRTKSVSHTISTNRGSVSKIIKGVFKVLMKFVGFDGLLFLYCVAYLIKVDVLGFDSKDLVFSVFAVQLFLFGLARVVLIPLVGRIPARKDFKG